LRPRALLTQFGIDVLATTDDQSDGLLAHQAIAADPTFPTKVIPTFRPDRYLEPYAGHPGVHRNHHPATYAAFSGDTRHDMSSRVDAGFLAELVAGHRLDPDEALDSLVQLVADQPRKVFNL
jgi:glucuronate isomerase